MKLSTYQVLVVSTIFGVVHSACNYGTSFSLENHPSWRLSLVFWFELATKPLWAQRDCELPV